MPRKRASRRATAPRRSNPSRGKAACGRLFFGAMAAVLKEKAEPVLSVVNIEVIYDHVILVLRGVSLQVLEGQIVALLGANGAGKTTTLKAISNLLRAERGDVTKGQIVYRGARIDQLNPSELVK